jgi:ribulose kinase
MKHNQELYDKARDEMLADMLDYIPEGLLAEVLADEWVLSKNPIDFVNALHNTLCDCLEDSTVEQYIRYGMGIETPEETLERLEEDRTHERRE